MPLTALTRAQKLVRTRGREQPLASKLQRRRFFIPKIARANNNKEARRKDFSVLQRQRLRVRGREVRHRRQHTRVERRAALCKRARREAHVPARPQRVKRRPQRVKRRVSLVDAALFARGGGDRLAAFSLLLCSPHSRSDSQMLSVEAGELQLSWNARAHIPLPCRRS
eukprot:910950-Pleurochrysis_carterae.AAC.2